MLATTLAMPIKIEEVDAQRGAVTFPGSRS